MQRIWIYTLSKKLDATQLADMSQRCQYFVDHWTAHEVSLDASFEVHKQRLLIFKVDEANYNASGCSIDKQVRFVKELEQLYDIELLNRLLVAYEHGDDVSVVKQSQLSELLASGLINEHTIVYNNTITNSIELTTNWRVPLIQTWLSKYITTPKQSLI
jgi:hypothetical protein